MDAKDVKPFNRVENEGFFKYSKVMDPRYKLASRTQLRDVLMRDLYKKLRVNWQRFRRALRTLLLHVICGLQVQTFVL